MRSRCSLSCASYLAASDTMRSMSALLRRPLSFVMTIWLRLPVPFSSADTFRMPLASRSKVTSIWGTPRGAGGMPDRSNVPSRWQSFVIARSPSKTWMCTPGWLSAYVEKIWLFLVGIVVLRLISDVMTPPAVSMPSVSGGHVEQQQALRLLALAARQDEGLHGGTVRHSLIRVDALVQFLATEKVRHQLHHLWNAGGAADEHHVVHGTLVHLGVLEHTLHRLQRPSEEVAAELLEAGASDGCLEVHVVEQRVDLNRRLCRGRQRALGALAGGAEAAEGALASRQVLALVLALELVREVRHEAVVKVLAAQVRVAVRRLHLKDATVDRQQRDIKRAAAKVKYEHIALLAVLHFVQAVRNGGSCRLIDDAQHLHPRDRAGILRRLSLGVVEVRGHRHHGLLHLLAQVRLRNLLHL
ncbi:putative heat-shock protein hsp70 [Trypanosoma cruzi]|uniref:Putative heat-shock protein hsp70 n=1 Tax=Trypanosoma cruzi TaxID=5693 RepID=A0A2V2XG58_TRYCR|nr:putative heat-shock protein hsp70 [Trypanosoma cruzi]